MTIGHSRLLTPGTIVDSDGFHPDKAPRRVLLERKTDNTGWRLAGGGSVADWFLEANYSVVGGVPDGLYAALRQIEVLPFVDDRLPLLESLLIAAHRHGALDAAG